MQYSVGSVGRVFMARADHGANVLAEIKNLAVKEGIRTAVVFLVGALEKASLVTGPKECTLPPEPNWSRFSDGRELLGLGTIISKDDEPLVHLHGSAGKDEHTLTGCVREEAFTYLVTEVVILEVTGTAAVRRYMAEFGLNILDFTE
ncbi:MAG: PPC domain-containing DNA-binding protein [Bacillota bacterium]